MNIDYVVLKEVIDSWNADPSDPTAFGNRVDKAIDSLRDAIEEKQTVPRVTTNRQDTESKKE